MMQVQIVSIQAALHGRPSILWHGDLDPEDLGLERFAPPEAVNEALFRYFNRVDEEDSDRLADLGYDLPSLSVGDLIHWNSNSYRVAGAGFERITDSSEYAMALTAYTLRTIGNIDLSEADAGAREAFRRKGSQS